MNAFEELRQRKKELQGELEVIESHLTRSVHQLERYQPHRVVIRGAKALLKRFAVRTGLGLLRELFKPGEEDRVEAAADNGHGQGEFWRQMSHQGLDLIMDYLTEPKETEETAV